MFSRFIRVVAFISISFLLKLNNIHCVVTPSTANLLKDARMTFTCLLLCLVLLRAQVSFLSVPLYIYSQVELLVLRDFILYLLRNWRDRNCFPKQFYHLPSLLRCTRVPVSPLISGFFVGFLLVAILVDVRQYFTVASVGISLMMNDVSIFLYAYGISISLKKCLFKSFVYV